MRQFHDLLDADRVIDLLWQHVVQQILPIDGSAIYKFPIDREDRITHFVRKHMSKIDEPADERHLLPLIPSLCPKVTTILWLM
jgi:hypothetical protein